MTKDILRRSELFAGLADTDLDWLYSQAESFSLNEGEVLIEEGTPGDAAYIVVEGSLEVKKKSDTQDILIGMREPGEVIGEMALLDRAPRMATVRAVCPSQLLKIRSETFHQLISQNPSAALAILHTVSTRLRQNEALLRQREKMAALGTLSAGLAHELNNPAAAVRRSLIQLRSMMGRWTRASIDLDHCILTPAQIRIINELKDSFEAKSAPVGELDSLAQSDRESALQKWLESIGISEAWELAPTLISTGWDMKELERLVDNFDPETLTLVVKWLAAGSEVYTLINETHTGVERISEIVKSVKAYSYLDQAPIQNVDVHEGLENTLVILRHKTREGITITRDYAHDLPHIEAHGSELNQVWTNIIDNAIDAMDGKGELILRTYSQVESIVVEIEDTGCGIPEAIQDRIFEPFYTTKPPGSGTGLGLHIAYTIIKNHNGRILLTSKPGKTQFRVTLPILLPK